MKLNNKGFAVSIILYSIIAVIILTLLLILAVYTTNIRAKMNLSDQIKEKISGIQTLTNKVLGDNDIISETPSINISSMESSDRSGLYKSTATNSGQPTYYFRGVVNNNYVKFGKTTSGTDLMWRIVRINEDGTVRLILDNAINSSNYAFYNTNTNPLEQYLRRYYTNTNLQGQSSNPQVKYTVDRWYNDNLKTRYSSKIVNGDYFCQQEKVSLDGTAYSGSNVVVLPYDNYIPDFRCIVDANGYGLVSGPIGLLTYDEVVLAGGYYNKANSSYYLYKNFNWFTMSPGSDVWYVDSNGRINSMLVSNTARIRPVINIRANVTASGKGTSSKPYVID